MDNKKQQQPVPATPVVAPSVESAAAATGGHFFGMSDWIAAALTFVISATLFIYYMSPSVTLQDSGELVTGAYNFGVPHPPGYPLWAFIGWVWRHLVPFGNPAWRICLMSVFAGAALTGVLTLMMTRSILTILRASPWADSVEDSLKHWIALTVGVFVSLMFAVNRGVWLWSCVPEMRVLSVFMFIITTFLFFGWMMRPDRYGYLYATVLVYALGIANHQTIAVMALPFMAGALAVGFQTPAATGSERMKNLHVFWELVTAALLSAMAGFLVLAWLKTDTLEQFFKQEWWWRALVMGTGGVTLLVALGGQGWVNRRRALICTGLFLLGAAFYLYMPIASSTNPPMNWGYASTKQGFLHAVSRGQYEKLNLAAPLSKAFFIQISLFTQALVQQYTTALCLLALVPLAVLAGLWKAMRARGRSWLIYQWAAFATTSFGLLTIINPGLEKQQQEINIKFFAPAHGFWAMLIGYGIALALAWALSRWGKGALETPTRVVCVALLALPVIPFYRNRPICDQRGHDFGYQFGYRMFCPGGDYPPMDKDAVLFGGTDPGRFVPTYMIFCESFAKPGDRFRDPNFDPAGGAKFDRRDVYIITQNALADGTYMSYIRDHYDFSRPDPKNPATIADRPAWQRAVFNWGWTALGRKTTYPVKPIYIPTERDLQTAFQQYVADVQARMRRGQPMDPDEQVDLVGGQVQVRGVKGVMNINGILTKWIHERNKDKHAFYVEESYVIPWMYPYMEPYGILLKINKAPLPSREQDPKLWKKIVARDTAYWDKLCSEFLTRREFQSDSDAQKTFSKLRSALGGLYLSRRMYNEAIHAFKQAQQLCPDSPEANFRLSQLYMELGRHDDAIATLEDYHQRDPLNAKIGMAVDQLRRLKEAVEKVKELEALRAKTPRDIRLVLDLAKTYAEAGQVERLPSLCESYLSQTNVPSEDMLQVAQIYLSFRQLDRCMAALQLITKRHPQESSAFYALAMLYAAQNQTAPALDCLEKACTIAPELRENARNDPRLNPLRAIPRFQKIVGGKFGGLPEMPEFPLPAQK